MEGFRNFVRGWFGKALLAALMIPFALFGAFEFVGGGQNQIATVDGKKIPRTEYEAAIERIRRQVLQQPGIELDEAKLQRLVADQLIDQQLILNQADKMGLQVTTQQIEAYIHQLPVFLDDKGNFSETQFKQVLVENRLNRDQLYAQIRQQLLADQLLNGISKTQITPTDVVNRFITQQNQQRAALIAQIPPQPLAPISYTPQQIQQYFQKNQSSLIRPETVDIQYFILNQADMGQNVQVTEADIQAAYQKRLSQSASQEERQVAHILIPVDGTTTEAQARQQIDQLAAQIRAGADFAQLAQRQSKDPGSAPNGGKLDYFAQGGGPDPAFEKSAFQLAVGQVSGPVRSSVGYHLIKLLDVRKQGVPELTSIRPELEAQAREDKLAALYAQRVSEIDTAASGADSLAAVAQQKGVTLQKMANATRSTLPATLQDPRIQASIFDPENWQQNRIPNGITLSPTETVWIQTTRYQASAPMTLAEATPTIQAKLNQQREQATQIGLAQQVIQAVQGGQPLQNAAQAKGLSLITVPTVSRLQPLAQPRLQQAILAMAVPADANRPTMQAIVDADQVYLVAVTGGGAGPTLPEELQTQLRQQLQEQQGQQDTADYLAYLRSQAKIKEKLPQVSVR